MRQNEASLSRIAIGGGLTPKVTLVLAFEKISIGMFYMVVYIVANEFFLDSINNFYHYAS
jgi:hypothetical protein